MKKKIEVKDKVFLKKLNKYRKEYGVDFFPDSRIDKLDPLWKSIWDPCMGMNVYISEGIYLSFNGKYFSED